MRESLSQPASAEKTAPRPGRVAAFYDLDGTLVRGNVVTHYLYFAAHDRSPTAALGRLARLAARMPRHLQENRLDRRLFNESFYRAYEGMSEDRLRVLGREAFERMTKDAVLPGARDLVQRDREQGFLTVLVTGALDVIAEPLARHLGIERVFANRLQFAGSARIATGALIPPVLAGPEKARLLREVARAEGIDLERSRAYADDVADLPFLSAVGRPCAVNPEPRLKAAAEAHHWPVLELRSEGKSSSLATRALDRALGILRMVEGASR